MYLSIQIKLRSLMTWYLREIRSTSIHYVECIMRFNIRQTSSEIENNAKNERLHNDQTDTNQICIQYVKFCTYSSNLS